MPSIPSTGMPLQLKKMYAGPLTPDELFESLDAATAYAASPSAYPGAHLTVKVGDAWAMYVVQDDKSLKALGGDTSADVAELSGKVTDLETASSTNATNIQTNTEAIAAHDTAIQTNTTNIQTNADAIAAHDTAIQTNTTNIQNIQNSLTWKILP